MKGLMGSFLYYWRDQGVQRSAVERIDCVEDVRVGNLAVVFMGLVIVHIVA
jgi:hypothetical protein